jgi:hypothetical protein
MIASMKATPTPITVPVGNNHAPERWTLHENFRTEAQFEVVRQIIQSQDFDFSCNSNFFEPESSKPYKGPVAFTYYTKDGKLHIQKIGSKGKILVAVPA